jgi:amino acid permease
MRPLSYTRAAAAPSMREISPLLHSVEPAVHDVVSPVDKPPPLSSFIAGYVNLTKTMIGSGVLALPFAFNKAGYVLGMFQLLLSWAGALTGLSFLYHLAAKVSARDRDASYYKCAVLSYPGVATLVDVLVGIKCVGVAISYLIVIGTLMPIATGAGDKSLWISVVGWCFCFPLSFLRSMNALRFSSLLGLVTVFYVIVLVVVRISGCTTAGETLVQICVSVLCVGVLRCFIWRQ